MPIVLALSATIGRTVAALALALALIVAVCALASPAPTTPAPAPVASWQAPCEGDASCAAWEASLRST